MHRIHDMRGDLLLLRRAIMAVVTAGMLWYFKRKGWLG
jgi:Mg2+ and Co2+ transporter CorA